MQLFFNFFVVGPIRGLKIHLIPFCNKASRTFAWFRVLISHLVKFFPLSDQISFTFPFLLWIFLVPSEKNRYPTIRNLCVNCAYGQARDYPIRFYKTSATTRLKLSKAINTSRCEGWEIGGKVVHRKVSHLLLLTAELALMTPNFSHAWTQHILFTIVSGGQVIVLDYKVGHVIILGKNNLMLSFKGCLYKT